MANPTNTSGPGTLGTENNQPIGDLGTLARTQHKPNAPQGKGVDNGVASSSASSRRGLTDADREFIWNIHQARHGEHALSLEQLVRLRNETARMLEQAVRDSGPDSQHAKWFQSVVDAYDEEIELGKTALGTAMEALRSVIEKPATEKDRRAKAATTLAILRQMELTGQGDNPQVAEAMHLIGELIKLDAKEKTDELEALVNKETGSSGAVSEEQFREKVAKVMGSERQQELMGLNEDEDDHGPSKAMKLVIQTLTLVSDRRINTLKGLIAQETRSPGSVSELQFTRLVAAVLGDERQKELIGLPGISGNGFEPVVEVVKILVKKRSAVVNELLKKQTTTGGVNNDQINQAIKDYDAIKMQARRLGIAVADGGDIPDQPLTAQPQKQ